MNDPNIAGFLEFIKSLWPSHRVTAEMLRVVCRWDDWLSGLRLDHVKQSVRGHRRDFPDGTKPEWNDVFRRIAGKGREDGSRANDFTILLRNVREAAVKDGHKGVQNWSDADAWLEYCRANQNWVVGATTCWRLYFQDMGEAVPEFLA